MILIFKPLRMFLLDIKNLEQSRKPFINLTRTQKEILKGISCDPNIIIKEADKGGAIVILDKKDYLYELHRQLDMREFYQPTDHDPTSHIQYILDVLLQEAVSLNYIQDSTAAFLNNPFPKVPVMYVLLKIHKAGFPPVGRPIIAGYGGLLQPPAQYLESFLQSFVGQICSYIKDTKHFNCLKECLLIMTG